MDHIVLYCCDELNVMHYRCAMRNVHYRVVDYTLYIFISHNNGLYALFVSLYSPTTGVWRGIMLIL